MKRPAQAVASTDFWIKAKGAAFDIRQGDILFIHGPGSEKRKTRTLSASTTPDGERFVIDRSDIYKQREW